MTAQPLDVEQFFSNPIYYDLKHYNYTFKKDAPYIVPVVSIPCILYPNDTLILFSRKVLPSSPYLYITVEDTYNASFYPDLPASSSSFRYVLNRARSSAGLGIDADDVNLHVLIELLGKVVYRMRKLYRLGLFGKSDEINEFLSYPSRECFLAFQFSKYSYITHSEELGDCLYQYNYLNTARHVTYDSDFRLAHKYLNCFLTYCPDCFIILPRSYLNMLMHARDTSSLAPYMKGAYTLLSKLSDTVGVGSSFCSIIHSE